VSWLLNVVNVMIHHLPLLNRYPVHHVLLGLNAFPIAARIAFVDVVAVVRGRTEGLEEFFVCCFKTVLVVKVDISAPQVVLIYVRKTFFLPS